MSTAAEIARQHLIDPEICIRCNTCEETCPVDAITHDARNYVVDFDKCNGCLACVSPCPTGSIDNWRNVAKRRPYSVQEQLGWDELPAQTDFDALQPEPPAEVPADVQALIDAARAGTGAAAVAPRSAAHPAINLYSVARPAIATVTGNFRLTADDASADIRHIVLDFGATSFPVLEGQSIGILAPGTDADGRPHHVRLYSIASPRDGERPGYNNVALTVKRVTENHQGRPTSGACSNYLCDLARGDSVRVVGPYGGTFLMPEARDAPLLMICTGTGSAPMRAMTERRRRIALHDGGKLLLYFGARVAEELPYFGPLMKLPREFIDVNLAFSRIPGQPKRYVQDLIRAQADRVAMLLRDPDTHVYICGLKGMEAGVFDAFAVVCSSCGLEWDRLKPQLLATGRLHVETY